MLPSIPLGEYRLLESSKSSEREAEVDLIRPLLDVTRHEIEAYCEYCGLEPRFDRSNLDTTYFRNWLRHEVLPLLATHNPNIKEVLRRSACVISADYELLRALLLETWPRVVTEETSDRIHFDLDAWRALPTGLKRSTIREAVHRLRRSLRDVSFMHVQNAVRVASEGTTGDRSTLPRGLMLRVDYDRLVIVSASASSRVPDWPLLPADLEREPIHIPGCTRLPHSEWVLEAELIEVDELPSGWERKPDPWHEFLDAESTGHTLWLRTRVPGDHFQPLGMKGHSVKLADFLTNQKVPRHVRDRLPLLAGDAGIVWVCGQRLDERFRVRDQTTRVLAVRFLREPGELP
jgi:tRNA(Ile)-lysidine synthase